MNALALLALALAAVWLAALTVVVILCIRQIALLTVMASEWRFAAIPTVDNDFSVADDGPEVGAAAPEEMLSALPELAGEGAVMLLLSATCGPCRKLATDLSARRFRLPAVHIPIIALMSGREELAEGLVSLLPRGIRILRDPVAMEYADALHIKSTPFAVAISEGVVAKKGYMYSASDFVRFVEGSADNTTSDNVDSSDSAKARRNMKEAGHVG